MTKISNLQEWITRDQDYKKQIKVLRQSLRMPQSQLAKLVNRTPRSIRNIENGEAYPLVTTLQTLVDELNADLIISLIPKAGSDMFNKEPKQEEKNREEIPFRSDIKIGETD
jgi:transcriptional regulator with XRE-family HTH domain